VIVALAVLELWIVLIDARADRRRLPEVERRPLHRREGAGRDQRVADRCIAIRVDPQLVAENVARSVAAEVEVAVLRQIDRRRLVAGRRIVDDQLVLVSQGVGHAHAEVAGIALFAVGARAGEGDAVGVLERFGRPHHLVEADVAAVQVVRPVVGRELVGLAVERELPLGDPVAVAADDRAEEGRRRIADVAVQRVEAEHDVADLSAAIGRLQTGNDAAVADGLDRDAVGIGEREHLDGLPIGRLAEWRSRHT